MIRKLPLAKAARKNFEDAPIIPISDTDLAAYLAMSRIKYEWIYLHGRIVFHFCGGDATRKLITRFNEDEKQLRLAFKRLDKLKTVIELFSPLPEDCQRWI